MRTVGVVCVALGIVTLIISSFPVLGAENDAEFYGGLACAGLLGLPLIVIGIVLTRRAAAQAGPEGEAAASDAFLKRGHVLLQVLTLGHFHVGKADPKGTRMERLRALDLNKVTLAGWLLVLLTGGVLLAEVIVFLRLAKPEEMGPICGLLFLGGFLLAAVFFCVGRLVLRALQMPFTKDCDDPPPGWPSRPLGDEENDLDGR